MIRQYRWYAYVDETGFIKATRHDAKPPPEKTGYVLVLAPDDVHPDTHRYVRDEGKWFFDPSQVIPKIEGRK